MRIDAPRDVGLVVRERRKRLGWSQETLAARAGVSRWWITALEGGKAGAPVDLVLRTVHALGLTVDVRPGGAPPPMLGAADGTGLVDLDAIVAAHTRAGGP